MRRNPCLRSAIVISLCSVAAIALANPHGEILGPGKGLTIEAGDDPPCEGVLLLTADGSWESGYAWSGGGVQEPDYGAFAEGYSAVGYICGIQVNLSRNEGYFFERTMDLHVYAADGENPGNVLSLVTGLEIEPPAIWPEVSVHEFEFPSTYVDGPFFVGSWGDWPGSLVAWYWVADLDGPQGRPRTNIAPGIGFPTGWQDVAVAFEPTRSMGLGVYVDEEPPPVPVAVSSWGRIKNLTSHLP